ncbi:hypothetical protein [Nocardioides sambongensis]|uniref:hypothetical protein n=1 Tax=Nocardioides sambongensis TaxID=2589074 RepID=UPI0015E875CA|nr:hypothetical protein [Nocardioides sambongensis]
MKTGTTYLQGKAYANQDALSGLGVELAGDAWVDQVAAVQEIVGMGRRDPVLRERNRGAWERMARAAGRGGADVTLLSMEFLAFADRREAARAVAPFTDRDVRVVITVRDTAAVIPALWQTSVTSGGTTTWPVFRRMIRVSGRGRGRVGRLLAELRIGTPTRFREAIDIPRMLRIWTGVLAPENVHVVVVPRPGAPRSRLWNDWCDSFGVDGDRLTAEPRDANESLGFPSAELVRRVNAARGSANIRDQNVVKNELGLRTLGPRRRRERRALLDRATFRAALAWNGVIRRSIEESGVVVHGDLEDLPVTSAESGVPVEDAHEPPTADELLAAARRGSRGLRRIVRQRSRRTFRGRKRRRRFMRRLRVRLTGPQAWRQEADPVDAAVADLVVLTEALVRLRRKRERQRARRAR